MASDKVSESLQRALRDLLDERARLDKAIQQLQGIIGLEARRAGATVATRGRGWSTAKREAAAVRMRRYWAERKKGKKATKTAKAAAERRSTKGWTAAARKAAADRMRRYWAERRKAAAE